jgi:probable rRNA maturation factor
MENAEWAELCQRQGSVTDGLVIRNRQRALRVDRRRLAQITRALLAEIFPGQRYEVGIYLVGVAEITRLNEQFVRHRGPTDVITFDYRTSGEESETAPVEGRAGSGTVVQAEIFICLEEAVTQARRWRSTWPRELVRYVTHGLLHLRGFDDLRAAARRRMKLEEGRLVRRMCRRFEVASDVKTLKR